MSKLERNFKLTDARLQQFGATVCETLPQDLLDFQAFDSTLPDNYADSIKAAIESIQTVKTDMVVIDEMAERTQAVNDDMAGCNTAFRTIKYFVMKCFPGNTAIHNQFGFNDIEKVRKNHARMLVFMRDFTGVTMQHKAKLVEAGCSEALVDSLPDLVSQLQNSKTEQEVFKKQRGLITQERVEKLNDLFDLLNPISDMAQIIYADDEARLNRYRFPTPKSASNSVDDLIS